MQAQEFIYEIQKDESYRGQIAHIEYIPARNAEYGELEYPLPDVLASVLKKDRIEQLYTHQAEAVNAARNNENFVVVTATASGKTLCYNLPVLETLIADPQARALYIYPTKALAQDQFGKLKAYKVDATKHASTYDGDVPTSLRPRIRKNSRIILTNPDMLHMGILPYHATWAHFFRNLKYVVIDEIHSYRGVFGSNVANIIRRLRRIAASYGSYPQFLCASATISNPEEHVRAITGLDAKVIDCDGSPSGKKYFVFWNPPIISNDGIRKSPNGEAVYLFRRLIESKVRTIVFTLARKSAELILRYTKQALESNKFDIADKIMSYRAGYRPEERREIERLLFKGDLLGVTSTNALELGVDIGNLDATIMTGYPGSIASTWQQAGRSGRSKEGSLAVLIALDNAIDQFLMRNPDYFFEHAHERAIIDPQNPYILAGHALCAAYELPIKTEEAELFGERLYEVLAMLGESGDLAFKSRWFWNGGEYPARTVNIRSTSSDSYNIVSTDNGDLMGTVDATNAFETIHPGAVYLHAGDSYIVEKLDLESHVAYVSRADLPYYTIPTSLTHIKPEICIESKPFIRTEASFGDVIVTSQFTGFQRKKIMTDEIMQYVRLDLPEQEFSTQSIWFAVPMNLADKLVGRGFDLGGTIHAIEHAAIGILPLFAMCDRQDIGGVSHPIHPDVDNLPAIFIYDAHPGGVGIAETAYNRLDELLAATLRTIEDCPCESGCPSCVQSPKCGNNNEPLDKAGAAFLLKELLNDRGLQK